MKERRKKILRKKKEKVEKERKWKKKNNKKTISYVQYGKPKKKHVYNIISDDLRRFEAFNRKMKTLYPRVESWSYCKIGIRVPQNYSKNKPVDKYRFIAKTKSTDTYGVNITLVDNW